MTLPLLIGNLVIGALDIQSDVESTLDDETLDAMRTLADQVAIAIETARLIGETRQALEQSQRIYRQYVQQEWLRLAEERQELGYQRNPDGIQPLLEPLDRAEVREVFHTGMIAYAQDESFAIAIPIKLREEILGVLDINASNSPRQWTPDDITLLKAVADRIALAMENARLIEETSRRANRERTVSEITTKIRSNTDPQSMLQTALEELKHVLGTDRIQVVPQRPGSRPAEPPAKDPSTQ
jgi:GAF domain-containing protein